MEAAGEGKELLINSLHKTKTSKLTQPWGLVLLLKTYFFER
jgi:hypothetical protein